MEGCAKVKKSDPLPLALYGLNVLVMDCVPLMIMGSVRLSSSR